MRVSVPLVAVAAAAALFLTACSGSSGDDAKSTSTPKASASATPAFDLGCELDKGDATSSVTVTGKQGAAPTVKVTKGATVKSEQKAVLSKGSGSTPKLGQTAVIGFAAYDGRTGSAISSPYGWGTQKGALSITLGDQTKIPGLSRAFGCVPVGSRVVYAAPAKVAFGSASNVTQNFTDGSVKAADEIVFVGDVLDVVKPTKANGVAQTPKAGFPTVKLAKDGTPTVTMPSGNPPTTTSVEVLKKGSGATVKSGATVTVQYQGTEWKSKKIFDESWGTGHGSGFSSTPSSFATDEVVKGFTKALVGQTVGSQVVVVIPPADGYGSTPPSGQTTITKTSTLVFVIDILYTSGA